MIPLLYAVARGVSYRRAAAWGAVFGLAFYGRSFFWIYSTCRFAGLPVPVAGIAWGALCAALSFNWVFFAWAAWRFRGRFSGAAWVWSCAAAWAAIEFIGARFTPGLGLISLAYTQWRFLSWVQGVSLAGPLALSFLIVLWNAAAADWLAGGPLKFSGTKARFPRTVVAAGVLAWLWWGYGAWTLRGAGRLEQNQKKELSSALPSKPKNRETLLVAILQPNVDQYAKWDAAYADRIRANLGELAALARALKPDLIVWPESSVPGWIDDPRNWSWIEGIARAPSKPGTPRIWPSFLLPQDRRMATGMNFYDPSSGPRAGDGRAREGLKAAVAERAAKDPKAHVTPRSARIITPKKATWGSSDNAVGVACSSPHQIIGALVREGNLAHNSAVLIEPNGTVAGYYHKRRLVPFGEFVPLRFLQRFSGILAQMGDLDPGPAIQPLFETPLGKTGATICYEAMFPQLNREPASRGARVLVNVTNDGWYKYTWGPYQHFYANIYRAVENRVYIVRAANTGISGMFDPCGRVTARQELGTRGVLAATIPVEDSFPRRSPYARWGDWFGWATLAVSLILMMVSFVSARFSKMQ